MTSRVALIPALALALTLGGCASDDPTVSVSDAGGDAERDLPAPDPDSSEPDVRPDVPPVCLDNDDDGYVGTGECSGTELDCNDDDPNVYPGALEASCDGRDENCDGRIDEGLGCDDLDRDGLSDAEDCLIAQPGTLPGRFDSGRNEGRSERCGNGIDEDCDGADLPCPVGDEDGDGFADFGQGGDDCDDADPNVYPGAAELCGDGVDQDCQGGDRGCGGDSDGDGYVLGDDCDDADPTVHPGLSALTGELAAELCDGLDNDCDGIVDEGNPLQLLGAELAQTHCGSSEGTCAQGWNVCAVDSDGASVIVCADAVGPAPESCDGLDNDCDGTADETLLNPCGGCGALNEVPGLSCGTCGDGVVVCAGLDATACQGQSDNACGGCAALSGAPGNPCGACQQGTLVCATADTLACQGDVAPNACRGCATLSSSIGAPCGSCGTVVCDGVDATACNDPGTMTYYRDDDNDGYGTGQPQALCAASGAIRATVAGDCADSDPLINPDAEELCDGLDNDCAGGPDDQQACGIWFWPAFGTAYQAYPIDLPGAVAAPVDRIRAAFDIESQSKVFVLTSDRYYVLDRLAMRWTASGLISSVLPEIAGRTITSAYSVPDAWQGSTGFESVSILAGSYFYLYDYDLASGGFNFGSSTEPTDHFSDVRGPTSPAGATAIFLDVYNTVGWFSANPSHFCATAETTLGPYAALFDATTIHINESGSCWVYVIEMSTASSPPFTLPGAPSPSVVGAATWSDGLMLFRGL
jgi:hypothetical protein